MEKQPVIEIILSYILRWTEDTPLSSISLVQKMKSFELCNITRDSVITSFSFIMRILLENGLVERLKKDEFERTFPYHYKLLEPIKRISYGELKRMIDACQTEFLKEKQRKKQSNRKAVENGVDVVYTDKEIIVDLRSLTGFGLDIIIIPPSSCTKGIKFT